jgi:hypothetical protein
MVVNGPNRAAFALVFGGSLSLRRGGLRNALPPGNMFVVSGPGPAQEQASNGASINSLLAALAGKSWKKTACSTLKGQRYPNYTALSLLLRHPPDRRYHDWPPIKELYYDGATTGILLSGLTRVPTIAATPPRPIRTIAFRSGPPGHADWRQSAVAGPCMRLALHPNNWPSWSTLPWSYLPQAFPPPRPGGKISSSCVDGDSRFGSLRLERSGWRDA